MFGAGLAIGVIVTPPSLFVVAKALYHCSVCLAADRARRLGNAWLAGCLALTASVLLPALYLYLWRVW